jgi:hypothetical protein
MPPEEELKTETGRFGYMWLLAVVSLLSAFGFLSRIAYYDTHPVVIVSLAIMTLSSGWASRVVHRNVDYRSLPSYTRSIMIFLIAFAIGLAFTYRR